MILRNIILSVSLINSAEQSNSETPVMIGGVGKLTGVS
jgi:hypothetical protein